MSTDDYPFWEDPIYYIFYGYLHITLFVIMFALIVLTIILAPRIHRYFFPGYHRTAWKPKPRFPGVHLLHGTLHRLQMFRTGFYGPRLQDGHLGWLGNNLRHCTNDQAVIHAGQRHYTVHRAVFAWFLGMVCLIALISLLREWLTLGRGILWLFYDFDMSRTCRWWYFENDQLLSTEYPLDGDFFSYIGDYFCTLNARVEFYYRDLYDPTLTPEAANVVMVVLKFFFSGPVPLFCFIILSYLVLVLCAALYPAPAPLVFDRQRKLVYTRRWGRLYVANWEQLALSHMLSRSPTLAVELYGKNLWGVWKPRWFTLRGLSYRGEAKDWERLKSKTITPERVPWLQQWTWLLRYYHHGTRAVYHKTIRRRAWHHWIVWFIWPSPRNLGAKVDKLLGDQPAPGDQALYQELYPKGNLTKEAREILKRNDKNQHDCLHEVLQKRSS